ncbi:FAD-binding protein [Sorangium sp. So ce1099]|uniref:FAD-binding protein n=1 Tax=Sorangium sp. So ce1099 TaxID=3133331 RepID=UPI003F60566F
MGAMDRARRIARTWTINTVNSCVYVLSGGKATLHEGRYDRARGTWSNWSKTFAARPRGFETPESEAEICQAVRSSKKVRVVGGGHTFNGCPLTGEMMLSLDRYNKVLSVDPETCVARVQAGIRLRDLMTQLQESGLTLPVMGSTNAQSVGGLVATDLHGSGRANGFLSEQVRSLRIVNAAGEAETFQRGSDVFHAAFGAIGTCGVVSEVELECIPAYNLGKELRIVRSEWIDRNIDRIAEPSMAT